MPSPQDFVTVQAPQARDYTSPLIGFQIGDRLAQLPEQYYNARMPAPVIDPATGKATSDPKLVMQALAERGGLQATLSAGLIIYQHYPQLRN
jgi:hypothetical protein